MPSPPGYIGLRISAPLSPGLNLLGSRGSCWFRPAIEDECSWVRCHYPAHASKLRQEVENDRLPQTCRVMFFFVTPLCSGG